MVSLFGHCDISRCRLNNANIKTITEILDHKKTFKKSRKTNCANKPETYACLLSLKWTIQGWRGVGAPLPYWT